MDLFLVLVLPLAAAAAFSSRLRMGVVGLAYLAVGSAIDVGFRIWVAGWAGRSEMGQCAILEISLFGLGLLATRRDLTARLRPTQSRRLARALVWLGWWLLIPATGFMVLNRLPP